MNFLEKTPDILAGHSVKYFINYNLFYFTAIFLLMGVQKLLIYPFIANKLGKEQFGSFILFITITGIIIAVIPNCINSIIIKFHSQYEKERKINFAKSGFFLNFIRFDFL